MKKLKKMMATGVMFAMLFSFSKSVGPGYYDALDACNEAGKNAVSSFSIDFGKYLKDFAQSIKLN